MKRRIFTHLIASASLLTSLLLSGCSLGMFGDGQDEAVRDSTGYREINQACSGLEISGDSLDVGEFRALLKCFNSNGAIDAFDRLFSALPDERLEPIVTTINETILNNKELLYKLEATHNTLKQEKLLDPALEQLGKLTENEEFIASGIALLKEGYFSGRGDDARSRTPDRSLLIALEKIGAKLSYDRTDEFIDIALNLASSKAFVALQSRFKGESPSGRSLRTITDGVLEHLSDLDNPAHVDVGTELIRALINGDLFRALDETIGTSHEDLRQGIPRLSAILRATMDRDGRIFNGLSALFHAAHQPLECVGGGATVKDPAFFILGELAAVRPENAATFIKKDNLLNLAALNPFCSLPAAVAEGYPKLELLADTSAIRPTVELIQALYRIERNGERPMAQLLVKLLADQGIQRLTPLLAELQDRGAWDDLLLVANLIDFKYRDRLGEMLLFLTAPSPELGGKSIYDVFTGVLLRTRPVDLYQFAYSLRHFTEAEPPVLAPALIHLRSAHYANDVYPAVDLAQAILSNASRNEQFFNTLFLLSEMPQFRDSVRLFSQMAQDGRLKDLIGSLLAIFHKSAQQGAVAVHDTVEPPFVPKRRHNLSAADLTPFPLKPEPASAAPACGKVDLGINLGDPLHPGFERQLDNVLACANSSGSQSDLEAALRFLGSERISDGRTALAYQIDLLKALQLSRNEARYLIDLWKREFDQGRFGELLSATPFWFSRKTAPEAPAVSELAITALTPLIPKGLDPLKRLGKFGATLLRDRDFPRLLNYLNELLPAETPDAQPAEEKSLGNEPEDHLREISDELGRIECQNDPAIRAARAREIVGDYREAITSWDLINGKQRRSWKKDDFRKKAELITAKLADPKQSRPEKTLMASLFEFMNYFSLAPGMAPDQERHYAPEYLGRWIRERATDYQVIGYYFPDDRGRPKRRARLVNSLDRLELVLINSDFPAPLIGKNYGLQFLAQIGEAWGDEPRERWPEAIRKKYKKGKRPQTLREAYKDIAKSQRLFEKLLGFPKTETCATAEVSLETEPDLEIPSGLEPETAEALGGLTGKARRDIQARLYNIRQVLPVIEENLPGSGHPVFDGGMKVFRDLFYQIHSSTPEATNGARDGERNNLSFVMWVSRMGAARQMGRLGFSSTASQTEYDEFFRALIEGAISEGIQPALEIILAQPGQALIWNTLDSVLNLNSKSTGQLRSSVFYALLAARQLQAIPKSVTLLPPLLAQHADVFSEQVDWGLEQLEGEKVGSFLRALVHDSDQATKQELQRVLHSLLEDPLAASDALSVIKIISQAPEARAAWNAALLRLVQLKKDPGYPQAALANFGRDLIAFFTEKEPVSAPTAERLRLYLADRLEGGELLPLLGLAVKNPVEFHQVLGTFSRHVENGELMEFLKLIRRGLSAE